MRSIRHWLAAAVLVAMFAGHAHAQPSPSGVNGGVAVTGCNQQNWAVRPPRPLPGTVDIGGNTCISSAPAVMTYFGIMTLSAATSTGLIAANVTMAGSTTLPLAGSFGTLTIKNTGSNPVVVCWFGGTCSAAAAGETLAAGASDTKNLAGSSVAPTLFSTSGTTLYFDN